MKNIMLSLTPCENSFLRLWKRGNLFSPLTVDSMILKI